VFEGIDGGGKTTLSNLVAQRLRRDLRVEHVREGGKFASRVTQAIRELGRDARNFALTPRAELMLYLAREVQLVDEATRPALARADVVIADRFVYTAEVLAVHGRGLATTEVTTLVTSATDLAPDLIVLVDVDPQVARARRRIAKLVARDERPPSRKGLAGAALQQRLRAGYRELAERDAARWIVVDNTEADLEALADAVTNAIHDALHGGVAAARARLPSFAIEPLAAHDRASAKAALLEWIDRRSGREPGLAAHFLGGVPGDEAAERRAALAERVPVVVAAGLRWLSDAAAWQLRHRLVDRAPAEIASSLSGPAGLHADAPALLRALALVAPRQVGRAVVARDDELAWELRGMLPADAMMRSLGGLVGERAWMLRERWIADRGGVERLQTDVPGAIIACASVSGLTDDRAWQLRKLLREVAPVSALASTYLETDDRAWRWRERFIDRAPKTVMKSISHIDDPRAWSLRERVAAHCEEAIASLFALDGDDAYALRVAALERWPATVIKSLGPLARSDRGRELIDAALARHPSNIALWREVTIRSS